MNHLSKLFVKLTSKTLEATGTDATEPAVTGVEWIKANPVQFTLIVLGCLAVLGVGYLVYKQAKKSPRRRRY
jgi:hypothetical protein